eukprot:g20229.t1
MVSLNQESRRSRAEDRAAIEANIDEVETVEVVKQTAIDVRTEEARQTQEANASQIRIDLSSCWKGFQELLAKLQPSGEVGKVLDAAKELCKGLDPELGRETCAAHVLQCSFLRLTAANALLELAAAIEEECLAPIVSTCIAARTVLNAVAQQIDEGRGDSQAEKSYVNSSDSLEPVPQVKQLMKITSEVEELSALTNPDINPVLHECHCFCWKLVQEAYRSDSKDLKNSEVATRSAACATLALGRTMALEAVKVQSDKLSVLEVRARLRAASLAAIGKVTSDLQVEAPLPEHWYQCCGTVVGGEGATNLASSPRSGGP